MVKENERESACSSLNLFFALSTTILSSQIFHHLHRFRVLTLSFISFYTALPLDDDTSLILLCRFELKRSSPRNGLVLLIFFSFSHCCVTVPDQQFNAILTPCCTCNTGSKLHKYYHLSFNCEIRMDDSGHRENGRHKPPQGQWLMHQPSMKQIMAIMAERDAAIQERNLALSEKKAALAERDMAILQRDSALTERNNAIMERDNAIATLQYRENSMNSGSMSPCPPGCQIGRGVKHMHHPQQHVHHQNQVGEAPFGTRDMPINDTIPMSPPAPEPVKPRKTKRGKEAKAAAAPRKTSKSSKKVKRESEDLNKTMLGKSHEWKGQEMVSGSDDMNRQVGVSKPDWKDQDLGLNQVAFDESTMPVPVCSCTGVLRPCYKWGNGGWQSSCCTTNLSMYPLPAVPNKRHARIGGRKMSGSAFTKLLSRLAAEGHDLSNPVDLKDHWAKHGTNRYITIK